MEQFAEVLEGRSLVPIINLLPQVDNELLTDESSHLQFSGSFSLSRWLCDTLTGLKTFKIHKTVARYPQVNWR